VQFVRVWRACELGAECRFTASSGRARVTRHARLRRDATYRDDVLVPHARSDARRARPPSWAARAAPGAALGARASTQCIANCSCCINPSSCCQCDCQACRIAAHDVSSSSRMLTRSTEQMGSHSNGSKTRWREAIYLSHPRATPSTLEAALQRRGNTKTRRHRAGPASEARASPTRDPPILGRKRRHLLDTWRR
jgi:hypothetical protein